MQTLTDNTVIYNLLEKANLLFPDFNSGHVLAFDSEDDFYVVIYTPGPRNFICFAAQNYLQHSGELPTLLQTVQDHPGKNIPKALINEAVRLIEDKLHSQNNSRFYFDAH